MEAHPVDAWTDDDNGKAKIVVASARTEAERCATAETCVTKLSVQIPPVIDDLNVFNMPYLFRDTKHMQKVIDGPIGQELMDKVTSNPKAVQTGQHSSPISLQFGQRY